MLARYSFLLLLLGVVLCNTFGDEIYNAGFVSLGEDRHNAKLYYILFKSRDENPTAPLIMYLEGGPGQSVMHGLFYQNGPFRLQKNEHLDRNDFSYNNFADVLYVDQPVGTGFSNCTNTSWIPHNETQIRDDLVAFLHGFYELHPEYVMRPFYLIGQGYASHFVLPFVHFIVHNRLMHTNLQGIALSSPWIRPELQLTSVPAFSMQLDLCDEFKYIASMYGFIIASVFIDLDLDIAAFDLIRVSEGIIIGAYNHAFNRQDLRMRCDHGFCNYNFSELNRFLIKDNVRHDMNTIDIPFNYTSPVVFFWLITKNEFLSDKSNLLIEFLDNGTVPIYLYTGIYDWTYNTLGMDETVASLHWHGREDMNKQEWRSWYSDGVMEGRYKRWKNLYYVHATKAGHYVGMDSPVFALDLMTRMIFGSDH
eukprot:TRINITY_DN3799_c0_g1_i1.p1 TRINITY_DN3799_c0_g1~~TRINITY_DN3799_c0_g1_i1.p1  ORF type:complete len:421 (+),score=108.01 TRINITY_DN3799_c0_g1_i1:194-1456(+)